MVQAVSAYTALTVMAAVAMVCNVVSDAAIESSTTKWSWDAVAGLLIAAWVWATIVKATS